MKFNGPGVFCNRGLHIPLHSGVGTQLPLDKQVENSSCGRNPVSHWNVNMAPTSPLLCSLILPLPSGEGELQPARKTRSKVCVPSIVKVSITYYSIILTNTYGYHCAVTSRTVMSSYVDRILFIVGYCELDTFVRGREKSRLSFSWCRSNHYGHGVFLNFIAGRPRKSDVGSSCCKQILVFSDITWSSWWIFMDGHNPKDQKKKKVSRLVVMNVWPNNLFFYLNGQSESFVQISRGLTDCHFNSKYIATNSAYHAS